MSQSLHWNLRAKPTPVSRLCLRPDGPPATLTAWAWRTASRPQPRRPDDERACASGSASDSLCLRQLRSTSEQRASCSRRRPGLMSVTLSGSGRRGLLREDRVGDSGRGGCSTLAAGCRAPAGRRPPTFPAQWDRPAPAERFTGTCLSFKMSFILSNHTGLPRHAFLAKSFSIDQMRPVLLQCSLHRPACTVASNHRQQPRHVGTPSSRSARPCAGPCAAHGLHSAPS